MCVNLFNLISDMSEIKIPTDCNKILEHTMDITHAHAQLFASVRYVDLRIAVVKD